MGGDHLTDTVGVYKAGEEDEWHEVLVQDHGVECQIGGDERPGYEEGDKAEEGDARFLAASPADFDDVKGTVSVISMFAVPCPAM